MILQGTFPDIARKERRCTYLPALSVLFQMLGRGALKTGIFDYVWAQFYNNPPCQYSSGSITDLVNASRQWTSDIPASNIFLGLPAVPVAAGSDFINFSDLTSKVLPAIKVPQKYYDGKK